MKMKWPVVNRVASMIQQFLPVFTNGRRKVTMNSFQKLFIFAWSPAREQQMWRGGSHHLPVQTVTLTWVHQSQNLKLLCCSMICYCCKKKPKKKTIPLKWMEMLYFMHVGAKFCACRLLNLFSSYLIVHVRLNIFLGLYFFSSHAKK